jgi:signal transduction histidine kinase
MAVAEFEERYLAALRAYLASGEEASLQRAYEIGRTALARGVGIFGMAALHHHALASILRRAEIDEAARLDVEVAQAFFIESLSAFEMTHRELCDTIAALWHQNDLLEEEARRIAHALHDEAGQLLASVHTGVDEIASELPTADQRVVKLRNALIEVEAQLRRLSHELRPTMLDDLGLMPTLAFLAQGVSSRIGIPIDVEGSLDGRLPPAVEVVAYRTVQEALTNVARHARATRVTISLRREGNVLHCSIQDDGIGFDPDRMWSGAARGLGLIVMRERLARLGATLQVSSGGHAGTRIAIAFPMA